MSITALCCGTTDGMTTRMIINVCVLTACYTQYPVGKGCMMKALLISDIYPYAIRWHVLSKMVGSCPDSMIRKKVDEKIERIIEHAGADDWVGYLTDSVLTFGWMWLLYSLIKETDQDLRSLLVTRCYEITSWINTLTMYH